MFSLLITLLCIGATLPSAFSGIVITSPDGNHGASASSVGVGGPCPDPGAIAPCLCLHNATVEKMDLLCELIQSEEQLAAVFTAEFPVLHFRRFEMIANTHVKVLRSGVFGNVSFEDIIITPGALHEVQEGVFDASRDTLQFLDLEFNVISSFPFHEIEQLTSLQSLNLGKNTFENFPIMKSTSLKHLLLASCPIFELPATAFEGLPNLETINMYGLRLSNIEPETFSPLTSLVELILANQILQLTHIPSGAFTGSDQLMTINLFGNLITSVGPDAFPVVPGMVINVASNRMKKIEENVWEQYVKAGITVALELNPLDCLCDIAWLFRTPAYLSQISGHCHEEGIDIQDLNPRWFEEFCP